MWKAMKTIQQKLPNRGDLSMGQLKKAIIIFLHVGYIGTSLCLACRIVGLYLEKQRRVESSCTV